MTDPFRALHRPVGRTDPGAAFHDDLLVRLRRAAAELEGVNDGASSKAESGGEDMTVEVETGSASGRKSRGIAVMALAAAALLIVTLFTVLRNDGTDRN